MFLERYLPDFDEVASSQIPAIMQLVNMGYNYISRKDIDTHRESHGQYILRDIAFQALRNINGADISDGSIKEAITDLEKIVDKSSTFVYNVYIRYNERRRELHEQNS